MDIDENLALLGNACLDIVQATVLNIQRQIVLQRQVGRVGHPDPPRRAGFIGAVIVNGQGVDIVDDRVVHHAHVIHLIQADRLIAGPIQHVVFDVYVLKYEPVFSLIFVAPEYQLIARARAVHDIVVDIYALVVGLNVGAPQLDEVTVVILSGRAQRIVHIVLRNLNILHATQPDEIPLHLRDIIPRNQNIRRLKQGNTVFDIGDGVVSKGEPGRTAHLNRVCSLVKGSLIVDAGRAKRIRGNMAVGDGDIGDVVKLNQCFIPPAQLILRGLDLDIVQGDILMIAQFDLRERDRSIRVQTGDRHRRVDLITAIMIAGQAVGRIAGGHQNRPAILACGQIPKGFKQLVVGIYSHYSHRKLPCEMHFRVTMILKSGKN